MIKNTVAVFVRRGDELLLGYKKRGFAAGRWDCFGGKIEPGESTLEAARRELLEESGLTAVSLVEVGGMSFDYQTIPDKIFNTVFICTEFSGEPHETEEMKPCWFNIKSLPYQDMWPDEKLWLPPLLEGQKIDAVFHYRDFQEILEYKITPRIA